MKVMAIVAHMDDAEIYCGGTLRKYIERGDEVTVLVVTNGNKGSHTLSPEELTRVRREEQREACRRLGANEPMFYDYEDDMMIDSVQLRLDLVAAIRKVRPRVIITHTPQDGSNDHGMVGMGVTKALISLPFKNIPVKEEPMEEMPQVFFMEPAGGVGFMPEQYVDITDMQDKKVHAFMAYESQLAYDPRYLENIEVVGRFRGYQAGCRFGEAFQGYRFFGFMPDFKLLP